MLSSPVAGVGACSCMFSYVGLVVSAGADDIAVVPGESMCGHIIKLVCGCEMFGMIASVCNHLPCVVFPLLWILLLTRNMSNRATVTHTRTIPSTVETLITAVDDVSATARKNT